VTVSRIDPADRGGYQFLCFSIVVRLFRIQALVSKVLFITVSIEGRWTFEWNEDPATLISDEFTGGVPHDGAQPGRQMSFSAVSAQVRECLHSATLHDIICFFLSSGHPRDDPRQFRATTLGNTNKLSKLRLFGMIHFSADGPIEAGLLSGHPDMLGAARWGSMGFSFRENG